MLNNTVILITGGTGSFGKKFTEMILNNYNPKKIIIYSWDEFKQDEMKKEFVTKYPSMIDKLRFFIGSVRNKDRLSTIQMIKAQVENIESFFQRLNRHDKH
ncbi:hypothetical protein GH811_05495 [Acetobacterium malicum]|uniref:Polysaccharide biosynthesis protein CapD-like domain-containing protein n=1 Tax=Acetobacterium malicum TaxID=52692 RepID=A0ABR6YV52_9FIRM|nr:hypothetical protein [Acetobacterium malicum]